MRIRCIPYIGHHLLVLKQRSSQFQQLTQSQIILIFAKKKRFCSGKIHVNNFCNHIEKRKTIIQKQLPRSTTNAAKLISNITTPWNGWKPT